MEEYLKKYDKLNKYLVFDFKIGSGGIGDLIKFFIYLFNHCIKHDIKIHYLINNIPLEKYLRLINNKLYIKNEEINNKIKIQYKNELFTIQPNIYYIVEPHIIYDIYSYDTIIPYDIVFEFPEIVKINCQTILDNNYNNYISLHLRLGDKYLETDDNYIQCLFDTRNYNEETIFNFIEENYDKNIIFLCDNHAYKLKIKEKYNKIIITNSKIGHTSLTNTTDKQVLDAITEFYLMTKSEKIVISSYSGFSIMAAKFKNIPIKYLYQINDS